jgi:hypothetical protein
VRKARLPRIAGFLKRRTRGGRFYRKIRPLLRRMLRVDWVERVWLRENPRAWFKFGLVWPLAVPLRRTSR